MFPYQTKAVHTYKALHGFLVSGTEAVAMGMSPTSLAY